MRTPKFLHEDPLNSASSTSPRRHQSASVASSQIGRTCLNLSCRAGRRKGDRPHAQNASSCRSKTVYNYMCRKETLTVHAVLNAHQFLDRITMTLINCPVFFFTGNLVVFASFKLYSRWTSLVLQLSHNFRN